MNLKLNELLGLIDLTRLGDDEHEQSISALCLSAASRFGTVAAVCIYPKFVAQAAMLLRNTPVKVATVANFPKGEDSLETVLSVIQKAITDGASEVDVVFPYRLFLSGEKTAAFDFIRACKQTCGDTVLLKVILETGILADPKVIAEVSSGLCIAGADFLKTSTGKAQVGATKEAVKVMLDVIKQMTEELNRSIGIKVSGGIQTIDQASQYYKLAIQVMGNDWVNAKHFRIGASLLVDAIVSALLSMPLSGQH